MARRFSASAADADDAYQRTLETIWTSAPTADESSLRPWAKTVARNEALNEIRRHRTLPTLELDDSDAVSGLGDPVAEFDAREQTSTLAIAIRRLRPDHARCLLLRADGLSYPEICGTTGFSYAKVNRCLSEGRKVLSQRYESHSSGADCERLSGALSRYADGDLDPRSAGDLELHLASCLRCKATLRDYRGVPQKVAGAFPVGIGMSSDPSLFDLLAMPFRRAAEVLQAAFGNAQEQVALRAASLQQLTEISVGKKAVAVVGISASLAATGAGLQKASIEIDRKNWGAAQIGETGGLPGAGDAADSAESEADDVGGAEEVPEASPAALTELDRFNDGGDGQDDPAFADDSDESAVPSDDFQAPPAVEPEGNPGTSTEFPELSP